LESEFLISWGIKYGVHYSSFAPFLSAGQPLRCIAGPIWPGSLTAISQDGCRFAFVDEAGFVYIYDTSTVQLLTMRQPDQHIGKITNIMFSADALRIAMKQGDEIHIYNTDNLQDETILSRPEGKHIHIATFFPDGTKLVCLLDDYNDKGCLYVWSAINGLWLGPLENKSWRSSSWLFCSLFVAPFGISFSHSSINSFSFTPHGARLAVAKESTVTVWDFCTDKETPTLLQHGSVVTCLTFSGNGARLASGAYDGTICIWDTTTGQQIKQVKQRDAVYILALGPDGAQLASGSNRLCFWDTDTGRQFMVISIGSPQQVAFLPDGDRVIVSYNNVVWILTFRPYLTRLEDFERWLLCSIDTTLGMKRFSARASDRWV
jgi:WD40 repeat protein